MIFLFALPVMMLLASCTDNITNMDRTGYLGEPKTLTASEIRSEALPGQIKLYWSAPVATTYEYMKVSYVNPADGRRLTQVVSRHTSELLISNTLQKYGDYTFTFQAYNADGTAASPVEVKARSGKAPASYAERSRTRVTLTASQLSTLSTATRRPSSTRVGRRHKSRYRNTSKSISMKNTRISPSNTPRATRETPTVSPHRPTCSSATTARTGRR